MINNMNWELIAIIYIIVGITSILGILSWLILYYKKEAETYEKKYNYILRYSHNNLSYSKFKDLLDEISSI